MFKINKTLVASAALIAAGFVVVAADMAQSRTSTNAAAIVEARFPSAAEAWTVVGLPGVEAQQAKQKPAAAASCTREHWPYVSDECLAGQGKRPARTIVIERRVADAAPAVSL